jgi:hypothetical protein
MAGSIPAPGTVGLLNQRRTTQMDDKSRSAPKKLGMYFLYSYLIGASVLSVVRYVRSYVNMLNEDED